MSIGNFLPSRIFFITMIEYGKRLCPLINWNIKLKDNLSKTIEEMKENAISLTYPIICFRKIYGGHKTHMLVIYILDYSCLVPRMRPPSSHLQRSINLIKWRRNKIRWIWCEISWILEEPCIVNTRFICWLKSKQNTIRCCCTLQQSYQNF